MKQSTTGHWTALDKAALACTLSISLRPTRHSKRLSHEKKRLNASRVRAVGELAAQELANVSFLAPKEFIEFLDEVDAISEARANTV